MGGPPAFNLKWWDFQKGRASFLSRVRVPGQLGSQPCSHGFVGLETSRGSCSPAAWHSEGCRGHRGPPRRLCLLPLDATLICQCRNQCHLPQPWRCLAYSECSISVCGKWEELSSLFPGMDLHPEEQGLWSEELKIRLSQCFY